MNNFDFTSAHQPAAVNCPVSAEAISSSDDWNASRRHPQPITTGFGGSVTCNPPSTMSSKSDFNGPPSKNDAKSDYGHCGPPHTSTFAAPHSTTFATPHASKSCREGVAGPTSTTRPDRPAVKKPQTNVQLCEQADAFFDISQRLDKINQHQDALKHCVSAIGL